jgi:hypothetical protein
MAIGVHLLIEKSGRTHRIPEGYPR